VHDNERLIRSLLSGVADPQRAGVTEIQASDMVLHFPGQTVLSGDHRGTDGARAFNAALKARAGGTLRFEVIDVMGGDDHAAAIYQVSAERDGETFGWRGVSVYRIRDGQVREVWVHPFEMDEVERFAALEPQPARAS
jgi:ketosteroid isomerase-like protein